MRPWRSQKRRSGRRRKRCPGSRGSRQFALSSGVSQICEGFALVVGRLASLVEVAVAAAAGNQVANLVVNDLHGGVVEGADSGAAAVDAESCGAGGEEKDGREVHVDEFLRCIEDEDELEICKCWGPFCRNYKAAMGRLLCLLLRESFYSLYN